MYNGIGLQTPRGSGTNGYIQSNKFHVWARPAKVEAREYGADEGMGGVTRRANKEILEHDRLRQIEVRLVELEEELVEKGFTDNEIQSQLAQARKELEKESQDELLKSDKVSETQTHQIAALKEEKLKELKLALKSENPEPGEAFDREIQKKKKEQRQEDWKKRQEERKKQQEDEEQRWKKRKESERRSRDDHPRSRDDPPRSSRGDRDDHSRSRGDRGDRDDHSRSRGDRGDRDDHSRTRGDRAENHSKSSRDDGDDHHSSKARGERDDRDDLRSSKSSRDRDDHHSKPRDEQHQRKKERRE